MAPSMPTEGKVFITKVSGLAYAFAATGGNLALSANRATNAVPARATVTEGAHRPICALFETSPS